MRRQTLNRLIIILFIAALALWINFAPGDRWLGRDVSTRYGLDLRGGVQVLLRAREANVNPEDMQGAAQTIERRVNGLGLSEAIVQSAGTNSELIIVELPGVENPESAIETLKGTGSLEFIDPQGQYLAEGTAVCTSLNPRLPAAAQTRATETLTGTQELTSSNGVTTSDSPQSTTPASPTDSIAETSVPTPTGTLTGTSTTENAQECGVIYQTIVDGSQLDRSSIQISQDQLGRPAVGFRFSGQAGSQLRDFTARNVSRPMSIVLDNQVISSPVIQDILPGEGIITMGSGTAEEQREQAQALQAQLAYGALPVPLEVESTRIIGPTLGEASVKSSTLAGIIGLLTVALFMIFYYHLPGLLAVIALLIYTVVLFAIYRLMPITLTLPGIAGFILSIGLAVDANVLIFARLREELRMGRSLRAAVENGFKHAWPSIRDSNAATFITTLILFAFGNNFGVSLIKGFALTLMLGVGVSLFSAVFVTRTLLRLVVEHGLVRTPRALGADRARPEGEVSA